MSNLKITCLQGQNPVDTILSTEQKNILSSFKDYSFELIRGAFHGSFTRLKVILPEGSTKEDYTNAMINVADAIGWHYYPSIDGVECIVKQLNRSSTTCRWKRSHKRKGIDPRIAQKANTAYFEHMNLERFEKVKNILMSHEFMDTLSYDERQSMYKEYNRLKRVLAYEA
jgi:hypothetical protein